MTLVDNGWERDRPDLAQHSASVHSTYSENAVRSARTAASFNTPYFDGRDIVAGALATFMLLAPLAVTAFAGGA